MNEPQGASQPEISLPGYVSTLARWQVGPSSATSRSIAQLVNGPIMPPDWLGAVAASLRQVCPYLTLDLANTSTGTSATAVRWQVSDPRGVVCLREVRLPLPPERVEAVVRRLGLYLASLHETGHRCLDVCPELSFVCQSSEDVVTVPTFHASPHQIFPEGDHTYIAPELNDPTCLAVGDPRCDVYGLGQIAWTLLSGKMGRHPSFVLPSDISPALAAWDEFIDATCRTHSDRRPKDIQQALSLLPKGARTVSIPSVANAANVSREIRVPAPHDSAYGSPTPGKRSVTVSRRMAMLGLGGLGLMGALGLCRSAGRSGRALRGFADTIIRYPARSYEGAVWKRVHSIEALRGTLPSHADSLVFTHVLGYDDENLWVTASNAFPGIACFFQLIDGHWEYRQSVNAEFYWSDDELLVQRPRLMTREKLIPCVAEAFYEVTPAAIRKLPLTPKNENHWWYKGPSGPALISEDYYVQVLGGRLSHDHDAYAVAAGKANLLSEKTKKEAFIHSKEFNAPLEEYRVAEIGFTASFARGHSVGLCVNDKMCKVVEFHDGRWWDVCDVHLTEQYESPVLDADEVRDAYFGTFDGRTPGFAVICGRAGRVIYRDFSNVEEDRSVAPRQESTTAELVRVWGVHPELYWLMDDKGEVWERRNGKSTIVVRGLQDSKLMDSEQGFRSVWVSPTGAVFAVTDKHLLRLG